MMRLVVPPDVTFACAPSFAAGLAAFLAEHDDVSLDVDQVDAVDLAFIQLVIAARNQAELDGKTLRLTQPAPEALRQLLHRAGFLDCPAPADLTFWFHEANSQ